jgi:hypothetical protein
MRHDNPIRIVASCGPIARKSEIASKAGKEKALLAASV